MLIAAARAQGVDPPRHGDRLAGSPAGTSASSPRPTRSGSWVIPQLGPVGLGDGRAQAQPARPRDNVTAGVAILRSLLRSADNTQQAVAGYYQGLAGVRQNGMYADTRQYVAAVPAIRAGCADRVRTGPAERSARPRSVTPCPPPALSPAVCSTADIGC